MGRLDDFTPRNHDDISIGYIGIVNDTKMHPRFAEMSAPFVCLTLVLWFAAEAAARQSCVAAVEVLGMGARVEIRGTVNDIRVQLEEFDIFGYPLAEDTYATSEKALQEAMWVGVPPVVFAPGVSSSKRS